MRLPELRGLTAAKPEPTAAGSVERRGGTGDELDRVSVALLRRVAPGDETVPLEQHSACRGIRLQQLGDSLRHVEARPLVVEPDSLTAERFLRQAATVR